MTYWRLYYHIVWGTKGRHPLIDVPREDLIRRSLRTTCQEHGALVHGIGVMPDHVHLAVSVPPRVALADFVGRLKGSSSYLLNHGETATRPDIFAWQVGYGVLSFSERALPTVVAYVENQPAHHAAQTLRPSLETLERPYDPNTSDRS